MYISACKNEIMRKFEAFLVLFFISAGVFAIQPDSTTTSPLRRFCFKEGNSYISIGTGIYGLANAVPRKHSVLQDYKNAGLPPVFFRYEKAISDYIGIGGTFFFHVPTYKWNKTVEAYNYETWTYEPVVYAEKYSGLSLGFLGRINYHFATTKNSDTYFGLGIGYEFYTMNFESEDPLASSRIPNRPLPFSGELVFGWRNYISDAAAIYAEIGYGKMLLNIGITISMDN